MSKRKNVLRPYDRVKIINPLVFVRCGYPLTKQIVKDTIITQEQKDAILRLMVLCGIYTNETSLFLRSKLEDNKGYQKILDVIAGEILAQRQWGGRERCIYTEHTPRLLNATGQVMDRRVVKTGTYCSGGHSYDYYNGGDDYDPPRLSNEKTHVILEIYTDGWNDDLVHIGEKVSIEKCYVELIPKEI